jgi:hypothetical protein
MPVPGGKARGGCASQHGVCGGHDEVATTHRNIGVRGAAARTLHKPWAMSHPRELVERL